MAFGVVAAAACASGPAGCGGDTSTGTPGPGAIDQPDASVDSPGGGAGASGKDGAPGDGADAKPDQGGGSAGASGKAGASGDSGLDASGGTSGKAGSGGTGGLGGSAGTAGEAGSGAAAGSGGHGGLGGSAGTSGAAGESGGAGAAGSGASGGTGGTAGEAGNGGAAGGGAAGSGAQAGAAGVAGASGSAGEAGTGGAGGSAGSAGQAGSAGAGGATGCSPENGVCIVDSLNGLCKQGVCVSCSDPADDPLCKAAYGGGVNPYLCIGGSCSPGDCRSDANCSGRICGLQKPYFCGPCTADPQCQADPFYGPSTICAIATGTCVSSSCKTPDQKCAANPADVCCAGTSSQFVCVPGDCCTSQQCLAGHLFYYFRKSSHGATNFLHVTVLS
jgi:hypothetical protein